MHSSDNGGGSRAVRCRWECGSSSFGYDEAKLVEALGTYGAIDKVTAPRLSCKQGTGVIVFKHRRTARRVVASWRDDSELKVWRYENERKDGQLEEDGGSVETTASGEGGLTSEEDLQTANKATAEEQVESEIDTLRDVKKSRSENVEPETHKRSRRDGREKKKEKKRRKKERRDKSGERKSREHYSAKSDDESRKAELVEQKRRRKDDKDKRRDDESHSHRKRETETRHEQEDSSRGPHGHRVEDGNERYCYRDIDGEEGDEHDRRGRYEDNDYYYHRNESRDKYFRRTEGDSRNKDRDTRRRMVESYDGEDYRRSHGERKEQSDLYRLSHEERRKRRRDRDDGGCNEEAKGGDYRPSWNEDEEHKGDGEYHSRRRSSKDHRDDERRSADDLRSEGNHRKRPSSRAGDRRDRGYRDWCRSAFPPYTLHPLHYSMYGYGYFGQEVYPHPGWYGYHGKALTDAQQKQISLQQSLPEDSPEHSHEQHEQLPAFEAKVDEDATCGGDSSSGKFPGYLESLRALLSRLSVSAELAGPEAYEEYLHFMADKRIAVPDVERSEVSATVEPDDDLVLEVDPEAEALLRSRDVVDTMFPPLPPDVFEDALKLCKQSKTE